MPVQLNFETQSSGRAETGFGGKILLSIFLGIFFFAGLFFFVVLVGSVGQTIETYFWHGTSASFQVSEVVREPDGSQEENPYVIRVRYDYHYLGSSYTSDKFAFSGGRYGSYEAAREVLDDVLNTDESQCLVDPDNPSTAILKRDSLAMLLFLVIPIIFMFVGGGGVYFTWKKATVKDVAISSIGISQLKAKKSDPRKVVKFIGYILSIIGLALVYYLTGDLWKQWQTKNWKPTDATVMESNYLRHESTDDDGHTSVGWSPDIFYTYRVDGAEFKSSRYRFISSSSSDIDNVIAITSRYGAGSMTIAYVNPDDPAEAVLSQELGWGALLYLIPLLVVGIGTTMVRRSGATYVSSKPVMAGVVQESGREVPYVANYEQREKLIQQYLAPTVDPATGYLLLKPTFGRKGKFFGLLFAAIFWNGIVSVFLVQGFDGAIFMLLFMVPFVLVGLGLVAGVFHQFLALFNPVIQLKVKSQEIRLGQKFEFVWDITGRSDKLRKVSIHLVGREEASYRRGTDTVTAKSTFADYVVYESSGGVVSSQGNASLAVPDSTMHSFNATNNKIIWEVVVKGEIPRWADISDNYGVIVTP